MATRKLIGVRTAPVEKKLVGLNCQTCGLCCAPPPETLLTMLLGEEDMDCLTPELENLMEEDEHGIVITFDNRSPESPQESRIVSGFLTSSHRQKGRVAKCPHFRGVPGMIVECEIYDRRPPVCSTFPPGCSSCLSVRKRDEGIKV